MMIVRCTMAAILAMVCSSCSDAQTCNGKLGDIYDSANDNRSEVFNFRTKLWSIQTKSRASIEDSSSEMAGRFKNCSDARYYCISTGLNAAIPKSLREATWRVGSLKCMKRSATKEGNYGILCADVGSGASTFLTFSPKVGILSYSRPGSGDAGTFVLRGGCGLFSLMKT